MGSNYKDDIVCPKCGNKQKMTVWMIVDAAHNTKTRQKIANGTFFNQKCKCCGSVFEVTYPMLIQDDINGYLVHYTKTVSQELVAYSSLKHVNESKIANGHKLRIVNSPDRFSEKVRIFESGLDDRVIDIMKVAIIESIKTEIELGRINDVIWNVNESGNFIFDIIGDKTHTVGVRKDFYNYLEDKCKSFLNKNEMSTTIVDMSWAIDFMENYHFKCM